MYYRALAISAVLALATGCTSVNPNFSLESDTYDDSNSGVVLFKTLSAEMGGRKATGLAIGMQRTGSDQEIQNVKGFSGFPRQTHYAMRLPFGEYELSSVFFYNGSMQPKEEGFRFTVEAGDAKYIGTILTDWGAPRPPGEYGDIVGMRKYKRDETCLVVKTCEVEGIVAVVNEGAKVLREFEDTSTASLPTDVSILPMK